MIEEIIYDYLCNNIEGGKVVFEEPEKPPKEYIIIEKTGSRSTNHIDTATVIVQCYSDTLYNAAVLNNRVKRLMEGMTALHNVSRCKCNGDYNFTDTTTKRYRYQAIYDITYYEE